MNRYFRFEANTNLGIHEHFIVVSSNFFKSEKELFKKIEFLKNSNGYNIYEEVTKEEFEKYYYSTL